MNTMSMAEFKRQQAARDARRDQALKETIAKRKEVQAKSEKVSAVEIDTGDFIHYKSHVIEVYECYSKTTSRGGRAVRCTIIKGFDHNGIETHLSIPIRSKQRLTRYAAESMAEAVEIAKAYIATR